jgi:hypothetical protein
MTTLKFLTADTHITKERFRIQDQLIMKVTKNRFLMQFSLDRCPIPSKSHIIKMFITAESTRHAVMAIINARAQSLRKLQLAGKSYMRTSCITITSLTLKKKKSQGCKMQSTIKQKKIQLYL